MSSEFKIGSKLVGRGAPPFLIAEIGQAHDGSLGFAHACIDAAADTGADAIKFQTHFADDESTLDEIFRVDFAYQDKTRFDYWKRMEFTSEQWSGLLEHCKRRGLIFLSSPFSKKSVEVLERLGVCAYKIGSGEALSGVLLDQIIPLQKPILLSFGMSFSSEIKNTVEIKAPKAEYPNHGKIVNTEPFDFIR